MDKKETEMEKHFANISEILLCTNATIIHNQTDAGYSCCYCNAKFKTSTKLKTHNLVMHKDGDVILPEIRKRVDRYILKLDITDLTCKLCETRIDILSDIVDHLMNEHKKIIYTDISNQILPIRFDKEDQNTIYCGICAESFSKLIVLQVHMNLHLRNYVCEICDRGYIIKGNLARHNIIHEKVESKPRPTQKKKERDIVSAEKVEQHKQVSDNVAGKRLKNNIAKIEIGAKPSKKRKNRTSKAFVEKLEEINKHNFNVREILVHSNATLIHRHTDMGYVCCFCNNQYMNPSDLKKHNLDIHQYNFNLDDISLQVKTMLEQSVVKLDVTDLKCNICDTSISGNEQLVNHLRTKHDRPMHVDIVSRIVPFKFDSEVFQCTMCPSGVFEKFKILQQHMHTHYRNYMCELCDEGFICKRNLLRHLLKHRIGDYKCKYCDKVFQTNQSRNNHERTVHDVKYAKRSKCIYCSERFINNSKKDEHLYKVHGVGRKELKCNACDRVFSLKSSLTVHKRKYHLMDKRFGCTECDMKFFEPGHLRQHMLKHTKVKEFTCAVCSKSYGRKYTLIEHMRIHNDDRRFSCNICGYSFVQKCSWKYHMKSRHNEIV